MCTWAKWLQDILPLHMKDASDIATRYALCVANLRNCSRKYTTSGDIRDIWRKLNHCFPNFQALSLSGAVNDLANSVSMILCDILWLLKWLALRSPFWDISTLVEGLTLLDVNLQRRGDQLNSNVMIIERKLSYTRTLCNLAAVIVLTGSN